MNQQSGRFSHEPPRRQDTWIFKFNCAFRGIKRGVRSEVNFFVHFFLAAIVVAAAIVLEVSRIEWCVLILCIGLVLSIEMLNTAFEWMARAITDQYDSRLRDALDMGSGAVLLSTVTAALVGGAILIHRLGVLLEWWARS